MKDEDHPRYQLCKVCGAKDCDCTIDQYVSTLEQQLANATKQNVMLREALKIYAAEWDNHWKKDMPILYTISDEALDTTADLTGYILCDAEPVRYLFEDGSILEEWEMEYAVDKTGQVVITLYKAKEQK